MCSAAVRCADGETRFNERRLYDMGTQLKRRLAISIKHDSQLWRPSSRCCDSASHVRVSSGPALRFLKRILLHCNVNSCLCGMLLRSTPCACMPKRKAEDAALVSCLFMKGEIHLPVKIFLPSLFQYAFTSELKVFFFFSPLNIIPNGADFCPSSAAVSMKMKKLEFHCGSPCGTVLGWV